MPDPSSGQSCMRRLLRSSGWKPQTARFPLAHRYQRTAAAEVAEFKAIPSTLAENVGAGLAPARVGTSPTPTTSTLNERCWNLRSTYFFRTGVHIRRRSYGRAMLRLEE
jgi:hypothetical protein